MYVYMQTIIIYIYIYLLSKPQDISLTAIYSFTTNNTLIGIFKIVFFTMLV